MRDILRSIEQQGEKCLDNRRAVREQLAQQDRDKLSRLETAWRHSRHATEIAAQREKESELAFLRMLKRLKTKYPNDRIIQGIAEWHNTDSID